MITYPAFDAARAAPFRPEYRHSAGSADSCEDFERLVQDRAEAADPVSSRNEEGASGTIANPLSASLPDSHPVVEGNESGESDIPTSVAFSEGVPTTAATQSWDEIAAAETGNTAAQTSLPEKAARDATDDGTSRLVAGNGESSPVSVATASDSGTGEVMIAAIEKSAMQSQVSTALRGTAPLGESSRDASVTNGTSVSCTAINAGTSECPPSPAAKTSSDIDPGSRDAPSRSRDDLIGTSVGEIGIRIERQATPQAQTSGIPLAPPVDSGPGSDVRHTGEASGEARINDSGVTQGDASESAATVSDGNVEGEGADTFPSPQSEVAAQQDDAPESGDEAGLQATQTSATGTVQQGTVHVTPHRGMAEISRHLMEAAANAVEGKVELTLTTDELGPVRMVLHSDDGILSVSIQADRQETLEMMRRNIESLARDFREAGYTEVAFSFDSGGGAASDPSGRGEGVPTALDSAESFAMAAPATRPEMVSGRLDIRF